MTKPWQPSDPWRTRFDDVSIGVHVPSPNATLRAEGIRIRTFADVAVETLERMINCTDPTALVDELHMLSLFAVGGMRLGREVIVPDAEEQAESRESGEPVEIELKLILGREHNV